MREIPDTSNFYCSLYTSLSRKSVAKLFAAEGWQVREPDDWDYVEVICAWAELMIESASPILLHGPVADVEANADRLLAVLEKAGLVFGAESYGPDHQLLREWQPRSEPPGPAKPWWRFW